MWLASQMFFSSRAVDLLTVPRGDRTKKDWMQVPFSSLKVGHIILIKKGESAPADVLILDSSEKIHGEVGCIVSTSVISGHKHHTVKKAMSNTKVDLERIGEPDLKGNMSNYIRSLSGKITAEYPTPDLKSFSGAIKLNNDPKISTASIDNMILRESVMLSDWAICLVIYTGFHTKMLYENSFAKLKPFSFFRKHATLLVMANVFIYCLLMIVSSASLNFIDSEITVSRVVSLFLPIVPMNIWFVIELGLTINKFLIEFHSAKFCKNEKREEEAKDSFKVRTRLTIVENISTKKRGNSEKDFFKVLNSESILDLGLTEYAVFDKTGTIVADEFEIRSISTLNKRYEIQTKVLETRVSDVDLVTPLLKKEPQKRSPSFGEAAQDEYQISLGKEDQEDDEDPFKCQTSSPRQTASPKNIPSNQRETTNAFELADIPEDEENSFNLSHAIQNFRKANHDDAEGHNAKNPLLSFRPKSESEIGEDPNIPKVILPMETVYPHQEEEEEKKSESPKSSFSPSHNEESNNRRENEEINSKRRDSSPNQREKEYNLVDSIIENQIKTNEDLGEKGSKSNSKNQFQRQSIESGNLFNSHEKLDPLTPNKPPMMLRGSNFELNLNSDDPHDLFRGRSKENQSRVQSSSKIMENLKPGTNQRSINRVPSSVLTSMALNYEYQIEKSFREDDLFNDVNNGEKTVSFLLRMLSVCHNAEVDSGFNRSTLQHKEIRIESTNEKEKALVKFANTLGFSLIFKEIFNSYDRKLGTMTVANRNGFLLEYDILGIIHPSPSRMRFTVVLYHLARRQAFLVSKGDPDQMVDVIFWDEDDRIIYNRLLKKNKEQGLKTTVFGYRELSPAESNQFSKNFKDAKTSLLNQERNLEKIGLEFENDLSYFGMVGFKDLIRQDASKCIQTFKKSGVKLWLLTGDTSYNAYNAAFNSDLLPKNTPEISFDFKREDFAISAFRTIFEKIKGSSDNSLSFTFLISGFSVDVIRSSEFLREHFKFLVHFCSCLVGYDLNPNHKEFLVSTLRSSRGSDEPIITAIGDGFNDCSMLKRAHFGVQVKNNHTSMISFGDGVTPSLAILSDLFQKWMKQFSYNMYIVVDYLFYCSFFNGLVLFFYEIMNNFTGVPLFQNVELFLHQNVLNVLSSLIFLFMNRPHQLENLENPEIHLENILLRKKLPICFLLSIGLATTQTLVFSVSLRFVLIHLVSSDGHPLTLEELFVLIKFFSVITMKLRILLLANSHKLLLLLVILFEIGVLIACETGLGFLNNQMSLEKYQEFPELLQCWVIIIGLILICFGFNLLVEVHICGEIALGSFKSRFFKTRKELSEKLKQKMNLMEDLPKITVSCFKDFSKIDAVLQNLFRQKTMENASDMSVSTWLQFKDKKLHNLFNLTFASDRFFEIAFGGFLLISTLVIIQIVNAALNSEFSFLGNFATVFVLFLWFFYIFSWRFKMHFQNDLRVMLLLAVFVRILILFKSNHTQFLVSFIFSIIFGSYLSLNFPLLWFLTVIEGIAYLLNLIIRKSTLFPSIELPDYYHYLICSVVLLSALKMLQSIQYLFQEKLCKMNYLAKSMFQEDVGYSKELLSLLMPKFVLNRLSSYSISENLIADDAGEVTILFCDIVDFDSIVHHYNDKIVKLLDELFRAFDNLCRKHGVQKIETVGKTYMAAGGLRFVEEELPDELRCLNFTKRVLDLANNMMKHVETLTLDEGLKLKIKIGINHGPTMFGVIGYHKPQFSLIGDAVNTTSRLCTTGKEGNIMMSEKAWMQVHSNKIVSEVVMTEMKGKGLVKVYHITQRKQTVRNRIFGAISNAKRIEKNDEDLRKLMKMKKSIDMSKFKSSVSQARMNDLLKSTSKFLEHRSRRKAQMTQYGMSLKTLAFINERPNQESYHEISVSNMNFVAESKGLIDISQMSENDPSRTPKNPKGKANQKKSKFPERVVSEKNIKSEREVQRNASSVDILERIKQDDEEEARNLKKEIISPNKFWLTFRSTQQTSVNHYKKEICELTKTEARFILVFCSLISLLASFLVILNQDKFERFPALLGIEIGFSTSFFVPAMFIQRMFDQKTFAQIFRFLPILYQAFVLFSLYFIKGLEGHREEKNGFLERYGCISLILVEIIYLGFNSTMISAFYQSFWWRSLLSCLEIAFVFTFDLPDKITFLGAIFLFYFLLIWQKNSSSRGMIDYYNYSIYSDAKDVQIADFVDRLLPKHVHSSIGSASSYTGEVFDDVTLLFADIVGFTAYSAGRTPREVVEMLSKLFTEFDKECSRLNLYKVYTIGDCYVVMSFRDKDQRDSPIEECTRVVEMGLSMISIIARVRKQLQFDGLHMRIGIHTGTIIGGILGTDIVRYDIYGENVVIANKMESSGAEDQINVSEKTMELLENMRNLRYSFEFNASVELKAYKKKIQSYFLKAKTF